jgi:hypothetical protein
MAKLSKPTLRPRKAWAICNKNGKIEKVGFKLVRDKDGWIVDDDSYWWRDENHIERVEIVRKP